MDKKDELTQIVRIVQEDKKQFELLYFKIVNKVYYWSYAIVRNDADALDMTQESMVLIYKNINKLKSAEAFPSWVYRLVRNHCLNYLKRHKRNDLLFSNENDEKRFEENIEERRQEFIPHEYYDLNETKKLVSEFIQKLPRRQREVITLFYLEEFKIEEIAEILDYNVGSVKSRLHDGRKNLEMQIAAYQKKHNVKLYNISLFAMMGLLLQEQVDNVGKSQNFVYDKALFMKTAGLKLFLTTALGKLTIVSISIAVATTLTMTYISQQKQNNTISNAENEYVNEQKDENMFVQNISYLSFPVRKSLDVTIELKQKVNREDIEVLFKDEQLNFKVEDQKIVVQVEKNGTYSIVIDNQKLNFEIDRIHEYAPELEEVRTYDDYLELIIHDELKQIDYDKSYLMYKDKSYQMNNSNIVKGEFDTAISVVLFHKEGQYIKYDIDLE